MRVCISVNGRFHAFYLAQQLSESGCLYQLITSYPKFEVVKYGIPKTLITCIVSNELLARGMGKLPRFFKDRWDPQFFLNERFDRLAAMRIKRGADIFIGWSGASLETMRKAKSTGMISVLERGSSHIIFQRDILRDEYDRCGIERHLPHPSIIQKELQEYEETDYIEVGSSFAKRTFIECGVSKEKIILGSRGVDINQFYPGGKRNNTFRIIHCGAISIRKGVQYLLRAFHELNLPHSDLWLIGSIENEIKPYLTRYYLPNIYLKGTFSQSVLRELYSQGSLFCMVSIEDGFGVVILQAMACGLPVICTTNCAGSDVVRDDIEGFVIPIRNVEALKEKIVFMYENQAKCKEMGANAYQRIVSNFTWESYGHKIIPEYSKIIERRI